MKAPTKLPALTAEQKRAMALVKNGADVYCYGLAGTLRGLQKTHGELISITPAVDPPDDVKAKQPYFGAILTAAGKAAIKKRKAP